MKKFTKWKSFDFGPETSVDENKPIPKKRKSLDNLPASKPPKSKISMKKSNFDFNEKIEPKIITDLVVHSKKIQELEGWLKTVVTNTKREKTEFLLLTGPTGCGKASTVRVLCKTMNIDITEWINPIDIDFEILHGPGQVTKFLDFFSESKYSSLFSSGNSTKKVLLVKDFPNALVRNSDEFLNVLEEIYFKATNPVIFICTDSSSNEINLHRFLFPDDVLLRYSITHFSFNMCAPSLLKRGLKRVIDILQLYPESFRQPSQNTIEAILASSMGDIRCAMNQLYLACIIGNSEMPVVHAESEKTGSKRKRNDRSGTIKHMVKDETLTLFHGLGRVLNPKRIVGGNFWKLNCDVQKLVDQFSMQPSMFASFLFENYLKYFGDLEDVQKSADILSLSMRLLDNWNNHDTLIIALWIAVFGLMIFNEHKASKWNQIKAPRKITKIRTLEAGSMLHPTDRFYYNIITKSERYHTFNCDF